MTYRYLYTGNEHNLNGPLFFSDVLDQLSYRSKNVNTLLLISIENENNFEVQQLWKDPDIIEFTFSKEIHIVRLDNKKNQLEINLLTNSFSSIPNDQEKILLFTPQKIEPYILFRYIPTTSIFLQTLRFQIQNLSIDKPIYSTPILSSISNLTECCDENNQTENNQTENNQIENNQTDNNQTDNNQTENNQTENNQIENNQTENNQTENNQTENNQTENNQTDNNQTENNQTENNQIENNQTENNQIENNQIDNNQTDNPISETDTNQSKNNKNPYLDVIVSIQISNNQSAVKIFSKDDTFEDVKKWIITLGSPFNQTKLVFANNKPLPQSETKLDRFQPRILLKPYKPFDFHRFNKSIYFHLLILISFVFIFLDY